MEFVLKENVKPKARARTCTPDDKTDHVIVITREGGRQGGGPNGKIDKLTFKLGPEQLTAADRKVMRRHLVRSTD